MFPRISDLTFDQLPLKTPIIESSCLHVECKLPINLRQFLAQQFKPVLDSNNDSILKMAAHADAATLSRVARAIRRYSTSRAREAWAECSVALVDFQRESARSAPAAALCLECARIEFGEEKCKAHAGQQCLTLSLLPSSKTPKKAGDDAAALSASIPDRLQRQIEEFRTMRAAFNLSHFDLDCYVTNRRVMFSWRPLQAVRTLASE